ncbi:hypothetical protein PR048_032884 [Dryococelus australis]|uniref:Uncharacterized protein n=1 Tax=Dryococelus australis TaxID=614101 RepID=A0ABQ9G3H5_9NEOP|nr:hypothetical protein PR048_032884 [Dryococelus australis]
MGALSDIRPVKLVYAVQGKILSRAFKSAQTPRPQRKFGEGKHVGAAVLERLGCSPSTKANRGLIPGWVTLGFSQVGIVPDESAGRWIFSGVSCFPRPFISALLHTRLASPISALKTSLAVKSQPNLTNHSTTNLRCPSQLYTLGTRRSAFILAFTGRCPLQRQTLPRPSSALRRTQCRYCIALPSAAVSGIVALSCRTRCSGRRAVQLRTRMVQQFCVSILDPVPDRVSNHDGETGVTAGAGILWAGTYRGHLADLSASSCSCSCSCSPRTTTGGWCSSPPASTTLNTKCWSCLKRGFAVLPESHSPEQQDTASTTRLLRTKTANEIKVIIQSQLLPLPPPLNPHPAILSGDRGGRRWLSFCEVSVLCGNSDVTTTTRKSERDGIPECAAQENG